MPAPVIALLTDFGVQDPFVGIMKGVIAGIAPQARTIDLSHLISPGDIFQAGIQLWQSVPYFPPGTVFLAVVDPGVGTHRRGLIMSSRGKIFIGPDNGTFSFILDETSRSWELGNPKFFLKDPGTTFHGRDIFAPSAAHAFLGTNPAEFGPRVRDPIRLPDPALKRISPAEIRGEILLADRFGNLLTSLGRVFRTPDRDGEMILRPWLANAALEPWTFRLDKTCLTLPDGGRLGWAKTYGNIPPGACAGVIGSSGLVELAAQGQSAAKLLGLGRGDWISLTTLES